MKRYGRGVITLERGRHRVRVPDGRGRYVEGGSYDTLEQAEAMRDALLLGRRELGGSVGMSVYDYGARVIERWIRGGLRDSRPTRSRWAIVAQAPFAHRPLTEADRAEIRDWARDLPQQQATRAVKDGAATRRVPAGRPLSWQSCKHALGLLRRIFKEAVEDGLISSNPAAGVALPKRLDRAEGWTWLTLAELRRLFALELTAEQRAVLSVAVYQGLRQGELAALDWSGVDLETGWLVVARSWGTATKSGRVRRIPLLPDARAALERWQPARGARRGLVFPGPAGELYARGHDWGWGDRRSGPDVPTRAGVERRVRFHDLRHTCASHLVSGSWGPAWTLAEVKDFLGHSAQATTERYSHLAPDGVHRRAQQTRAPAPQPADNLPQGIPLELAAAAGQVLDFVEATHQRAVGDSNARLLAPEAYGLRGFSAETEVLRQLGGRSAAHAVLEAAGAGVELPAWAVIELARAALRSDPIRALTAMAGRAHAARAAVELAELALAPTAAKAEGAA